MSELEDLLKRAAAGDKQAAEELVERYDAPLRAAIRRRLGGQLRRRLDTDDIFQSAFVEALDRLAGFEYRSEKEFIGWLAQVAERRIQMQARRHGADKRDIGKDRVLMTRDDRAAELTAPPDRAHKGDVHARLKKAIKKLPEQERRVVEMHTVEGRSFGEIAAALGLKNKDEPRYVFRCALKKLSVDLQDS